MTEKVQFWPGLSDEPHRFVSEKLPLTVMLVMLSAEPPVLVRVTDWEELDDPTLVGAKVRLVGFRVATGALEDPPVPLSETFCGLAPPVSEIVSEAVRKPEAAGVKITVKVQFAPAANEFPQLFDWLNSVGSAPVMAIDVMVTELELTLLMTTFIGLLVWPRFTVPKFKLDGTRLMAVPVPVRDTVCGLFGAVSLMFRLPLAVPICVGVNVTLIVQLAPAATEDPQLFVWL